MTYANARLLALPVPPAANGSFTVYVGTGLFVEPNFHPLPYVWYEANSLDDTFLQTPPCLSLAPQWTGLDGGFGGIKGVTSLSRPCLDWGTTNSPSSQFYFEEWAVSSQVQISLNYTLPLISLSGNQSAGAKPPFPPPAPAPNVYASTSPNQIFFINCFINDANSKIQLPGPIPPIPLPAALYPALQASGVSVFFISTSISSGWIVLNPSAHGPTTFAAQEGSTGPSAGVSGSQNGGLLATGGAYRTLVSLQGYPFSFSLSIPLVDLNIAAIQLVGEAYAQYDTVSWSGDPKDLNLTPDNNCLCQSRDVSCYPPTGPCWNVTDEAPALGYDPTHPDYWRMNPGNPMNGETWPSSVQDLENNVAAMCFNGSRCESNSSTYFLQNYFAWDYGSGMNLTVEKNFSGSPGLTGIHVNLPQLVVGSNATIRCSSFANWTVNEYGIFLECQNASVSYPNGTLMAARGIYLDTSVTNVTLIGTNFTLNGLSSVNPIVRNTDGNLVINPSGFQYLDVDLNPAGTQQDTCGCNTMKTEQIENPEGACTVPVVFLVPPVVVPCPPPPPPAPSPATNPEGGVQGPGQCVGSCGRGSSGTTASATSSVSSGLSSGSATSGSATTSSATTAAAGTTVGGSGTSGSVSTTGPAGPEGLGWGWRSTPPPPTWQVPVISGPLSSPCTPGSEYLDSAADKFMDCNTLGVWEAREYTCPSSAVCADSIIVNGVPLQTVINSTDLGNGTKELTIGLFYNWTEAAYCPACGLFLDNSGREYFNQSWVYNPVLNLILDESNGSQVIMHNNVTLICGYPIVCNVSQSVDPATNLTNAELEVSIDGSFLVNFTGYGITNIICEGPNLQCPQNNTEVTFKLTGFANLSAVPSFSVDGGLKRAGINLELQSSDTIQAVDVGNGSVTFKFTSVPIYYNATPDSCTPGELIYVWTTNDTPIPGSTDPFDQLYYCRLRHPDSPFWESLATTDTSVLGVTCNGYATSPAIPHSGLVDLTSIGGDILINGGGPPTGSEFDFALSSRVLKANGVVNMTEIPSGSNTAVNLTYGGVNYYIPSGLEGLLQVQFVFPTTFQWGTLTSGLVDLTLTAIGNRVTVYIPPFGFNDVKSAGTQALIVSTDPLPFPFWSQLASGAQVGQAVAFYDLINFVVLPAYPYVNFYQRLVFSSQANSFGGDTSGLSALTSFGGASYSYLLNAAGISVNCTGVHWNVSTSLVNMGDVQYGGSPGHVDAEVAVVNDGNGDIGMFQFAFRGGSAAGWTATSPPGTCPPALTLPPGQSCGVKVRFTPSAADGIHGATLTLNYRCLGSPAGGISAVETGFVANAIASPVTTVPPTTPPPSTPTATNVPFAYTSSWGPANLASNIVSFGQEDSSSSIEQRYMTFTLAPGGNHLLVTSVSLVGDPGWFIPTNTPGPLCQSLPSNILLPGHSCNIGVDFNPAVGCVPDPANAQLIVQGYYVQTPEPPTIYMVWKLTVEVGGCGHRNPSSEAGVAAWSGGALAGVVTAAGGFAAAALGTGGVLPQGDAEEIHQSSSSTGGSSPSSTGSSSGGYGYKP